MHYYALKCTGPWCHFKYKLQILQRYLFLKWVDTHIQTIIFGRNNNKFHYCIWKNLKVISLKLNSGESKTKYQQVKDFIYILNDIIFKLKEWRNEV